MLFGKFQHFPQRKQYPYIDTALQDCQIKNRGVLVPRFSWVIGSSFSLYRQRKTYFLQHVLRAVHSHILWRCDHRAFASAQNGRHLAMGREELHPGIIQPQQTGLQ